MITASYRPRNPGHDYYGRGVYLITIVVNQRSPLLGQLGNDVSHPNVTLSQLGMVVKQAWKSSPRNKSSMAIVWQYTLAYACPTISTG